MSEKSTRFTKGAQHTEKQNNLATWYYYVVLIFSGQVWEFSDLNLICPPVNSAPSSATPYRECLFDGVSHILGCLEESL